MKLLVSISFLFFAVALLNAEEAAKDDDVKSISTDDIILPIHIDHDNCTLNSQAHDFGDLWQFANGKDADANKESVIIIAFLFRSLLSNSDTFNSNLYHKKIDLKRYSSTLWNQANQTCVMLTHSEQWFVIFSNNGFLIFFEDSSRNQRYGKCNR